MTNAASSRQIAARAKQTLEDREAERHTITNLMSHPMSRRWMWLQLGAAQVYVEDSNTDPGWMAFQKGRRNLGLALMASILRHTPNEYVRMLTENSSANLQEADDGRTDDQ